MNLAKAREYFSAYHEGTLDRGLKQSFEAGLSADAQLQAEYKAFEAMMAQLPSLAVEVPEPEFDLHERISARVDRHIFETQRVEKPGFLAWWKGLLVAGAAATVIVPLMLKDGGPETVDAHFGRIWTRVEAPGLSFVADETKGVHVKVLDSKPRAVVLKDEEGKELTTFKAALETQVITNADNELAEFVFVEVEGMAKPVGIALPGSRRELTREGSGTLREFAVALCNFYGEPVSVWVTQLERKVSWNFDDVDSLGAARRALKNANLTADKQPNMLRIQAE